jgi:hypothetical protein
VDPQIERALSHRPGLERSILLENLSRLGLAMLNCAGVGTAVPVHKVIQQAGFEGDEGAKWIDIAQFTGLLKRDVVTGALRFLHPRLQEFLAALALSQCSSTEREHWLRSNIDNPWLEEIYLLIARRDVDISSFSGSILDETEASLKDAGTSTERSSRIAKEFILESRLSLLGRMLEAGRLPVEHPVVTRMAELLVRLERSAEEHPLPELRWPRILRAVRGPLISHPQLGLLIETALTSTEAWRKEAAFRVLARSAANDARVKRRLAIHLLEQAVRSDLLLEHKRLDAHLADEPKLMDLRRLAAVASIWQIILIVMAIAGWAKVCALNSGVTQATFSVFVSIIFYVAQFSRRSHRPTAPSALISHLLVLLFHTAALLAWTSINIVALGVDWLVTERGPSLAVMLHTLGFADGSTTALTYSILATFLAAFWPRLVNWLGPPRKTLLRGFAAGLIVCATESVWVGLPPWALVWMCVTGATILLMLARSSFSVPSFGLWIRRRPVLGTAVVLVVLGNTLPFLILAGAAKWVQQDFLFRVFSAEGFATHVRLLSQYIILPIQSLLWLAILYWVLRRVVPSLGTNLGALLLARAAPPGPLRLTQLSLALRVLSSSLVVLEGRKAAIRRLGEMEPPSEALVLALLEYSRSRDGRVEDRPELAKAVDALQERLRREPEFGVTEQLRRELPVLAAVTKAWRSRSSLCQAICQEWMMRLGIVREDLEIQASEKGFRQSAEEVLQHLGPREHRSMNEGLER